VKVLVAGHLGILGRALMAELPRRGLDVVGVDVAEMDVVNADSVNAVVGSEEPAAVINCAAFTDVDGCERWRDVCFAVNAAGAGNVAAAAAKVGARIFQISTDYVFDGEARVPYKEDAEPHPLSTYGGGKLEGERRVAGAATEYVIVRTAWLFGPGGANFVSKILARAKNGEQLAVVNDQRGSPTYAGHLAKALAELLGVEFRGFVHVAGGGVASWYDVAAEVLRLTEINVPLKAITAAELNLPARRPAYSALDTSLYAELTGEAMPSWREGLREYLINIGEVNIGAR
jgi:dTDP-4-dehydrorhamnose reductase